MGVRPASDKSDGEGGERERCEGRRPFNVLDCAKAAAFPRREVLLLLLIRSSSAKPRARPKLACIFFFFFCNDPFQHDWDESNSLYGLLYFVKLLRDLK